MIRRFLWVAAATALVIAASATLFAHEHFRIIGTITKHQDSTIAVKKKDAKITEIRLDKQTEINRDKKKVQVSELKVGQSVVVDAYGDTEDDLLALEIRIVPTIGAAK